uniref:Uncharacterized protein n=1 Tax=Clytia hemisphaerica TaxID=252671 RepID=A0A7M6DRG3_9CNID
MHDVLDFFTREIELPKVEDNDKNEELEDSVSVSLFSLPHPIFSEIIQIPNTQPDPSKLIFKHHFDDSKCLLDVKNHITKGFGIPGDSQILLRYFPETKSYKASPLPESVKISSLLMNAKGESIGNKLILLLAVCQQGEIESKLKEQLLEYNIPELKGFTIKGYESRHIIMMANSFEFNRIVENTSRITGLRNEDQMYHDDNGVTVDPVNIPENDLFKDIYLSTKSLDQE